MQEHMFVSAERHGFIGYHLSGNSNMRSQIIKSLMVAISLLLITRPLHAWQTSGSDAAGTGLSEDPIVDTADSAPNGSSTAQISTSASEEPQELSGVAMKPTTPEDDAPPGYLDGTFLWNPAWRHINASTPPKKGNLPLLVDLQLSEEQIAKVQTLSAEMKRQMEELIEAASSMIDRGAIELAAVDQAKAMQWQQAQNRGALALKMKFGQAFMELLSEPQRNEMYRRSMLMGGTFALLEPSLREKFQLTEAQVDSLHKIRDKNWHSLRTHFLSANSRLFKNAEPCLATAYEQLTDEQKAQYQQFIATPFVESKAVEADQATDAKQPGTTGITGGPFGDGGKGFFPDQSYGSGPGGVSMSNPHQVSSGGLMITWSENNDELRGFSTSLGEWDTLTIEKQDGIVPIVNTDVAAVRIGDSMAAFSAAKAQWDVIRLSEGSQAVPVVFNDYVKVEDNGHLYTFAAAKGRWTSPTDPEFTNGSMTFDVKNVNLVTLRNQFDEWLKSLPRYKGRGVRVMFTFNGRNEVARIDTDRKSVLTEVEAKLNELSALSSTDGAVSSTVPTGDDVRILESRVARLRDELLELDIAVRDSTGTKDSSTENNSEQQRELHKLVEKSFDLRQQMQRLEAQRMKLRLQLIETNLDAREKARESIIDRRTEELINGTAGSTSTQTAIPRSELVSENSASISGSSGSTSRRESNVRTPAEFVAELRKLRQAVREQSTKQKAAADSLAQIAELKSEGGVPFADWNDASRESFRKKLEQNVESSTIALDRATRDWQLGWSEYQSQLRMLQFDIDEAKLVLEQLLQKLDRVKQLFAKRVVPGTVVQEAESPLAIAKINLQRAEEMLKLYADIETQEPQLNPDSLKINR